MVKPATQIPERHWWKLDVVPTPYHSADAAETRAPALLELGAREQTTGLPFCSSRPS
jgi:hypothetical protein